MRTFLLTLLLAMIALPSPAEAQQRQRYERENAAQQRQFEREDRFGGEATPREVERSLPYLAYTLGELHYLAFACEGGEAQQWRERMLILLEMETPGRGRLRARLIESFNDGYALQQRYRPRCGAEADAEKRALAYRGRDLANMMRDAYFD
jgi:uncharacterized protein (TIGR02301 family)